MTISKTLHGTTQVTIGDAEYTLTPTLAAVRMIESQLGGLLKACRACDDASVDAMAVVVTAGAGLKPAQAEQVAEDIFANGAVDTYVQLRPYLLALLNPRAAAEAAEEAEGNAPAKRRSKAADPQ